MLEAGGGAPRYFCKLGCLLWIMCALIVGGYAIYGMKYLSEWSERKFEDSQSNIAIVQVDNKT